MRYRGYLATFIDVEADNEQEAEAKMLDEINRRAREKELGLVIWDEPNLPSD